jgi:threonine/homoserine/homoserine lactone efflux protein
MLWIFSIALIVSFLGSIPPGSINISVMQYAMQEKKAAALSFALAAALVEFVYAGFAVKFQMLLTENISFSNTFRIISASLLVILGVYNLIKKDISKPNTDKSEKRNAFKKGTLIAMANPLAIPFWLAVTAYLDNINWINLTDNNFLFYVIGISVGTFSLLAVLTWLGAKFSAVQGNKFVILRVPGLIFISMGVYTYFQ